MKKLVDLNVEGWFLVKNSAFTHASANVDYDYEVVKETEKAIQIKITNDKKTFMNDWFQWLPKSAIIGKY